MGVGSSVVSDQLRSRGGEQRPNSGSQPVHRCRVTLRASQALEDVERSESRLRQYPNPFSRNLRQVRLERYYACGEDLDYSLYQTDAHQTKSRSLAKAPKYGSEVAATRKRLKIWVTAWRLGTHRFINHQMTQRALIHWRSGSSITAESAQGGNNTKY